MSHIRLGESLHCDLAVLAETRLLINAASGGGKSRTLRLLAERTHGKIQHIIIDPEGEFQSLREKFDYVIAAKHGGDAVADPRSAELLATKLLELRVSAVVDIFDLKKSAGERKRFVRLFLEALMAAPKRLWHPVLIMLDEAHDYAPEGDESESLGAVVDLASQGRKRGYCLVAATQRLSKLSKDVAAELRNVMIGTTVLDVDQKRAADVLGFDKAARLALRDVESGWFWTFGPALVKAPTLVHMDGVLTTHPKIGERKALPPPPPTEKILALLPQLADLPAEAEEKARTEKELKKELAAARARVTNLERAQPTREVEKVVTKTVEVPVLKDGELARIEAIVQDIRKEAATATELGFALEKAILSVRRMPLKLLDDPKLFTRTAPARPLPVSRPARRSESGQTPRPDSDNGSLPKGERLVLRAIVQAVDSTGDPADREYITQITGYKRSTRDTYLQRLRERLCILPKGGGFVANEGGREALGDYEPLPTGDALLQWWLRKLPSGEATVLKAVSERGSDGMTRDEVGEATGYKRSTRDTYIQRLATRRLVSSDGGAIVPSIMLFDQ